MPSTTDTGGALLNRLSVYLLECSVKQNFLRSISGLGVIGFIERNVESTIPAIPTSRYHFRSSGTIYHGASTVEVLDRIFSYAVWNCGHSLRSVKPASSTFHCFLAVCRRDRKRSF